jgi:hypothetical protein
VLPSVFAIVSRETDLPGGGLEVGRLNVIYRYLADQPEDELWVEVRLDADWVAACLIEPEDGQPVIAEVRVLPYEDDMEHKVLFGPGEWSGGSVPPGGVPLEKVRSLRTERILRVVQDELEQGPYEVEYLNDVLADFGL